MRSRAKRTEAIEELMRASLPDVERLGMASWAFTLVNGEAHCVTAWIADEEWLVMDGPLRELPAASESWELLKRNCRLAGLGKHVLTVDCRAARLRAEIPLHKEADFQRRLRETCAGFEADLRPCGEDRRFLDPCPSPPQPRTSLTGLASLCAEAGWAPSAGPGAMRVELAGQRTFLQATLESGGAGSVRAFVDLATCGSWSAESRWALAMLLLCTSRVVRLARGFAEERKGVLTSGFEVRFGCAPSPFELASALGALSTACGLASQEAQVLEDVTVARAYLDLHGS